VETLRTPEDRFTDLPGYAFTPHYATALPGFEGLRMHYVDEGAADAPIALCLHGQPTWSYIYRKMIPGLVAGRMRVIAPDFFGFGRSDKPVDEAAYSIEFHRNALMRLVEHLDLKRITLVCQDWGGIIGLTLPMDLPGRFGRLIVMNTTLGTGDEPLSDGFLAWRAFCNRTPDMDIAALMKRAVPALTEAESQAYGAPYPDIRYKAGVRRFPNLVPDRPDADGAELSRRARDWWRNEWTGMSFMAIGVQDPVLGLPVMKALRHVIRGCPDPLEVSGAGHFVQEAGEAIVKHALEYFQAQRASPSSLGS